MSSDFKPSVEISKSSPRFSWIKHLLASVAVIFGCLYIAAAIYYLSGGIGEKSVPSTENVISGNIHKPKVDAPSAIQSDTKSIEKEKTVVSSKRSEAKSIHEEAVRNLINKWLASWQSGNMETYLSCYASDFQSKGMNLDAWISNKTNVRVKSKNIIISIDNVQISAKENIATAIFIQHYSSSKSKDSGKKTLELKKINNEWKIYREIM